MCRCLNPKPTITPKTRSRRKSTFVWKCLYFQRRELIIDKMYITQNDQKFILRVLRNGLVQKFSNHLLFIPFLYYYYFNGSSARTIFIRLKLVWAIIDMLELEDIPGSDFNPSICTLYGKMIHYNCPLKQCNNFISFREPK